MRAEMKRQGCREETGTRTGKKPRQRADQSPREAGVSIKKERCKNSSARPTGLENKNKMMSANTISRKIIGASEQMLMD